MIEKVSVSEILSSTDLIAEYAKECSIPSIGEINPQAEIYAALERSGMMHSFMAYSWEKAGFAIILMPVLPHYGKKIANYESLFISKAYRRTGIGRELMFHVEQFAKDQRCEGILYSAPKDGQLEKLLESSKSYTQTNSVFFRSFHEPRS